MNARVIGTRFAKIIGISSGSIRAVVWGGATFILLSSAFCWRWRGYINHDVSRVFILWWSYLESRGFFIGGLTTSVCATKCRLKGSIVLVHSSIELNSAVHACLFVGTTLQSLGLTFDLVRRFKDNYLRMPDTILNLASQSLTDVGYTTDDVYGTRKSR